MIEKETRKDKDTPPKKSRKSEPENYMREISTCMSTVARAMVEQAPESDDLECHKVWAKLLVIKLSKLPLLKAENLKLNIDRLVLASLEEEDV